MGLIGCFKSSLAVSTAKLLFRLFGVKKGSIDLMVKRVEVSGVVDYYIS
jgi:hypothetical protein